MRHFVGKAADFEGNRRAVVRSDGRDIVVLQHEDTFHAFENQCPHMGGPVGEGRVIGKVEAVVGENKELLGEQFSDEVIHLVCPWHGWEFEINSGRCAGDQSIRLSKYDVEIDGDDVYVAT